MQLTTIALLVLTAGYSAALPTTTDSSALTLAVEVPSVSPPLDVTNSSSPISARGVGVSSNVWREFKLCTDSNLRGVCMNQRVRADQSCYNLSSWMNDKASSVWVSGAYCWLYKNGFCSGESRQVRGPVQNLGSMGFNDKTSSFKCQYYTNI